MDFPAFVLQEISVTEDMEKVFGVRPVKAVLYLSTMPRAVC